MIRNIFSELVSEIHSCSKTWYLFINAQFAIGINFLQLLLLSMPYNVLFRFAFTNEMKQLFPHADWLDQLKRKQKYIMKGAKVSFTISFF